MKKWILMLIVLISGLSAFSQGIEFRKETYADMLKMAKKQNRLVFIDVYTSWCGPCKYMATKIFTEAKAGKYFNAHFLNLKLDAEKSEDGKAVAKKFGVSAYPTCIFVDGEGNLIYRFLGGRTVELLVKEGEKALEAYNARPLLEKYRKKYEKGNRKKEFLLEYFDLKNKSGLDCSDVLKDYFTQVDDAHLLDSVNLLRISKMTVYDAVLAGRLVEVLCRESVRVDKDKKKFALMNKAVCTYLGAALKSAAKSGSDTAFEELLSLKKRLFEITGNHDSVVFASMGGSQIYIPSDLSRLDYYSLKGEGEKFMCIFRSYMLELQKEFEAERPAKEAMKKELDEKLKKKEESGNEEEYIQLKKTTDMLSAFSSIDENYVSTNLIDAVGKYENFYTGEKDESFSDQIVSWYVFLHEYSPSAKTAVYVADKLLEKGRKGKAVEVLTLGLEEGNRTVGVKEEDVKACKAMLEKLTNN